jgi:hypothetical protein
MTLREIIYMIMDELKIMSDDSTFNENHIKFLVDKYRATLLLQQSIKSNVQPSESNYQTIDLVLNSNVDTSIYGEEKEYMKSTTTVPNILSISNNKAASVNIDEDTNIKSYFNYKMVYTPENRFDFIGFNKWLKNIVYWTIKDNYVYVYSKNEDIALIKNLSIKAIFENTNTDLDDEYPLEAGLVPLLIQSVVQELSPRTIQPEDSYNNASDDKANLTRYLASNTKSDLAKQLS